MYAITGYYAQVRDDAYNAIKENFSMEELAEKMEDRDSFEQELYDSLWIDDSVTGNASGSYTFNSYQAREYVLADMDTVREALTEFCVDAETIGEKFLNEDWEYLDVTARCYVLGNAISEALDNLQYDVDEWKEEQEAEVEEDDGSEEGASDDN